MEDEKRRLRETLVFELLQHHKFLAEDLTATAEAALKFIEENDGIADRSLRYWIVRESAIARPQEWRILHEYITSGMLTSHAASIVSSFNHPHEAIAVLQQKDN